MCKGHDFSLTEEAFNWVMKGYGGFLETETGRMALHIFKSTFIEC